jgi:hypothetical protein
VKLPGDVDHSLPNAGAASKANFTLTAADAVADKISLSFDWNFVADVGDRSLGGINDFAVFTVTDGVTSKVFKLSDARMTDWGSSGWRTSVYDITHDFAFNAYGEIRLTVGFAVLNDANPTHPSHFLLDNVRLNRSLGADFDLYDPRGRLDFLAEGQIRRGYLPLCHDGCQRGNGPG